MEVIITVLKIVVGLSILNVWLKNASNSSQWRGGNAQNMKEEFLAYGLPDWSMYVIGFFKVSLAIVLITSIWIADLTSIGSLGLAFFLSGSVLMHIKIKDPLKKSIPAAIFLAFCIIIATMS